MKQQIEETELESPLPPTPTPTPAAASSKVRRCSLARLNKLGRDLGVQLAVEFSTRSSLSPLLQLLEGLLRLLAAS